MPKFVALSKPSFVSNDDIVPAAKPSLVSAAEAPFTGLASGLIWIIFSPIAGVSENGEPPKLKLTVELSLETVPSVSQPVKSDEKSSKMVCANPAGAVSAANAKAAIILNWSLVARWAFQLIWFLGSAYTF